VSERNLPYAGDAVGILRLVRLVQSWNAQSPMLATRAPIVKPVSPAQPTNALFPMLVTLSGIIMLVRLVQPSNARPDACNSVSYRHARQPGAAHERPVPMMMRLAGIVTLVRFEQPSNAPSPMLLTG